jgi:hypothetical protein
MIHLFILDHREESRVRYARDLWLWTLARRGEERAWYSWSKAGRGSSSRFVVQLQAGSRWFVTVSPAAGDELFVWKRRCPGEKRAGHAALRGRICEERTWHSWMKAAGGEHAVTNSSSSSFGRRPLRQDSRAQKSSKYVDRPRYVASIQQQAIMWFVDAWPRSEASLVLFILVVVSLAAGRELFIWKRCCPGEERAAAGPIDCGEPETGRRAAKKVIVYAAASLLGVQGGRHSSRCSILLVF